MKKTFSILLITALAGTSLVLAAPYKTFPLKSKASFILKNPIAPNLTVTFNQFDYTLDIDQTNQQAKVFVKLYTNSLTSSPKIVENDIKSPKNLDAKKFKTMTYESNSPKFTNGNITSFTGTMTIKGISAPATFKSNNFRCQLNKQQKNVCSGTFVGIIDRTKFEINYPTYLGYAKNLTFTFVINNATEQ